MPKIISNRRIVDDAWRLLDAEALLAPGEDGFVPEIPSGDVLAPIKLWQLRRDELTERTGRTGVLLAGHDAPEAIAPDLARLALLAVRFDKFSDGRGYSLGRLLRERYGWRGELRATGDIRRDQLLFLSRCGFDAFALADESRLPAALGAFEELGAARQFGCTRRSASQAA